MSSADIQTTVIGAGVVGLAIAAALARSGREVMVLEAEAAIGQGASSRNSEVIHAGIYYPPGSLKARVCVTGNRLLYEHCHRYGIKADAIGKLIVATDDSEIETLQLLQQRAAQNAVADLQLIDQPTAVAMQPGLHCVAALHSPSTGIIDSHALMLSLHGEIENHGGLVVCNAPVDSIDQGNGIFKLSVTGDSAMSLTTTEVINCCGLNAVSLAYKIQHLPASTIPSARFARGNYFRLQGRTPFTSLIYPAPVSGGLGVHLTIDTGGQARFGPDVEWIDHGDSSALSDSDHHYKVDPHRADSFYAAIRKYWPALPDNSLLPDYAGIRPKIERPDVSEIDFEIATEHDHGVKRLINLYGIESPGLTSCLAIAQIVRDTLV